MIFRRRLNAKHARAIRNASGERIVRSAEGARRYGVPIGTPISAAKAKQAQPRTEKFGLFGRKLDTKHVNAIRRAEGPPPQAKPVVRKAPKSKVAEVQPPKPPSPKKAPARPAKKAMPATPAKEAPPTAAGDFGGTKALRNITDEQLKNRRARMVELVKAKKREPWQVDEVDEEIEARAKIAEAKSHAEKRWTDRTPDGPRRTVSKAVPDTVANALKSGAALDSLHGPDSHTPPPTDQQKSASQDGLQRWVDEGTLAVNVPHLALLQVWGDNQGSHVGNGLLKGGTLRSSLASTDGVASLGQGREGGSTRTRRAEYEDGVFGGEHPVYGYVRHPGDKSETLDVHGPITVLLDHKVKDRATVTVGDSLMESDLVAPTPANRVGWESIYGEGGVGDTADKVYKSLGYPPVETQIMGPITKDDVTAIVFRGPEGRSEYERSKADYDRSGVKVLFER